MEKVLSVFVDEAGDFGEYNPASPYYFVALVMHDQSCDISANISALEQHIANWGYPNHAIHTGPLIRRENVYENDLMERRKSLFNALYHFSRKLDISYICPYINQKECVEKTKLEYTEKLSKEIVKQLRENMEYLIRFDRIIVYYDGGQVELTRILTSVFNALFMNVEFRKMTPKDYKLAQVADLVCTLEHLMLKPVFTKSEIEFFHSKSAFKKNIYKNIASKKRN